MRNTNMTHRTVIKIWFVLPTLISVVLSLSCSAESNAAGKGNPSSFNTSNGQGGISSTSGNTGVTIGTGAVGTQGSTAKSTSALGPDECAGAHVQAARIKPTVLFVVDRSGSTADAYAGSSNRWQAMYDALMDPQAGVISKLQSVAFFGMVLFDGPAEAAATTITNGIFCMIPGMPCDDGGQGAVVPCPRLVTVNPALNNYTPINDAYLPSGPGGTTPTALSLKAAYELLGGAAQVLDQKAQGKKFVILCTDGLPNGCMDTFSIPDQQGPIDQLTAAAKNGIKTYVVGVAADAEAQAYLDQLATYGDTGSPAFSPASKEDLVASLSQIVGGAVGCQVKLNGTVVAGQECSGAVQLNSQPLECNGTNGWKLVNENEITLQGTACQQFMNDSQAIINASFPCGVFVLE